VQQTAPWAVEKMWVTRMKTVGTGANLGEIAGEQVVASLHGQHGGESAAC
jgi:hypothetical protein